MIKKIFPVFLLLLFILIACYMPVSAQESQTIRLPKPQTDGGKPLMQVLKERTSSRTFDSKTLPRQILSNLLWAAFGVNRAATEKRTAPSALNQQEIDIYVAEATGLYLYDAKRHALVQVLTQDIRGTTGTQQYVKDAPVNLVFVADFSRMGAMKEEEKVFYSAADTGFIGQNVYLYCASERLATVIRGSIDRQTLSKVMKLRPDQRIILAQSVGYHKD